MKWSHTISVEVPDGPDDWREVECRLNVEGTKGRPATFNASWGNWEPPEDPELELLDFEIRDGDKWRLPGPDDRAVEIEVDLWWFDRSHECWESMEEYGE